MRKAFFSLVFIGSIFFADVMYGHTLTFVNFVGTNQSLFGGAYIVPVGNSTIILNVNSIADWNYYRGVYAEFDNISLELDYQLELYSWGQVFSVVDANSSIVDLMPSFQLGMGSAFMICGFGWILRLAKRSGGSHA